MKMKNVIIGTFFTAMIILGAIGGVIIALEKNESASQVNISQEEKNNKTKIEKTDNDKAQKVSISKEEKLAKIQQMSANMKVKVDDMEGVTFYMWDYPYEKTVAIKPYVVVDNDTLKGTLRNLVSYRGDDWIFFTKILVKTDSGIYTMKFRNLESESDVYSHTVYEWYDIIADKDTISILNNIATSSTVKVRFSGKYSQEKILTDEEIDKIKMMLELYNVIKK